ncbi:hypothetical protein KIM372_15550 [Bombiscardovia nodaiensis]|uniref:S1 motif domain-containing protein n=1 Tax=Bombiscardovia nodaiensis TaxID=2932181 RepID=A0ABM8B9S5_9BIFI|nr:hypothetical protein KIM372_15550 [Bombiscardovia nodaiensis]
MPNRTHEDLSTGETSHNSDNNSERAERVDRQEPSQQAEQESAPRRRRGGRRVVRGTGAADAHVPVQVEAGKDEDESPRRRSRQSSQSAQTASAASHESQERGRGRQARGEGSSDSSEHSQSESERAERDESRTRSRRRTSTSRRRTSEQSHERSRADEYDEGRERADSGSEAEGSESDSSSNRSNRSSRSNSSSRSARPSRSGQSSRGRQDREEDQPSGSSRRQSRSRAESVDDEVDEQAETSRSSRRRRRAQTEQGEEGDERSSGRSSRSRSRDRSRSGESQDSETREGGESDSRSQADTAETASSTGSSRTSGRSSRASRAQAPARPMTSLLFQEPIIPAHPVAAAEPEFEADARGESDQEDEPQSSRRTRTRKGRTSSSGRHASRGSEREREHERESEDEFDSESEEEGQPRRRRSRRLNAEERQAANEVELIEQDLREEAGEGSADEEEAEPTIRRRRRSRRGEEDEDEGSSSRRRRRSEPDEDDEEGGLTRRRRRRRGAKDADEEPARRSRRQQYVDEITDIEGSTRLEAKKQRRRDNRRERSKQTQLIEQDFLARRENVNRLMVVREKEQHTQISVIEDGTLVEHYVSDIDEVSSVGNIYLGRVQNVLPSMEAAFVDIGQARNGVLYAGEVNWDSTRLDGQPRRIELAFKSGDPVLVQVTKDPIGHKGARLTSQVTLAGRFLVLVPSGGMTGVSRKLSDKERSRLKSIVAKIAPKDMGIIIRTAAEGASEEAITKDLENLQRQWEDVESKREEFWHGKRPKLLQGEPDVAIRVVRDIFNDDFNQLIVEGDRVYDHIEHYLQTMAPDLQDKLVRWEPEEHQGKDVFDKWQIDSQLRKGMERQVYLPSGGSLVIDRTEAMTTIDVNTGRYIGKGKSLEETVTRCNLEAAEEIARQLRLRDIGGMVMIDFVDMVMPANRDLVLRRLVECLARDRTKHQVAEVTSLGLVQMTRKRVGQGLVEAFSEECPTCHGRGFILHDKPTVSTKYDDPYAAKGGDPFVKTIKHAHTTKAAQETPAPQGSSPDVKAKLAQIAAAAEKAAEDRDERDDRDEETDGELGDEGQELLASNESAQADMPSPNSPEEDSSQDVVQEA